MSAEGYQCPQAFACWIMGPDFDWRSCPLSSCVKCPRRTKSAQTKKGACVPHSTDNVPNDEPKEITP